MELQARSWTEKSGIYGGLCQVMFVWSLIKIMSEMWSTTTPEVTLLGTPSPWRATTPATQTPPSSQPQGETHSWGNFQNFQNFPFPFNDSAPSGLLFDLIVLKSRMCTIFPWEDYTMIEGIAGCLNLYRARKNSFVSFQSCLKVLVIKRYGLNVYFIVKLLSHLKMWC